MKPSLIFITYIVGFILFYQVMSFFNVDEHILFFLKKEEKTPKASRGSQKEGDILTPPDATKPLKLTKQEIGRHAWAVLHSVAASYPTMPTDEDKVQIENFIKGLAKNFPCKICGKHFVKILEENPIKHNSREDLVYYMCDIHNIVNKFLGKEIFNCEKAFDIWGGDCGCDA